MNNGRAFVFVLRLLAGWLLALAAVGAVRPALAQGAPDQLLFGPVQYNRTAGPPNQYSGAFTVPASAGAPFQLRIVNGSASGQNRISSGWVKVNGVQVVGPADFGQNVALIERNVNLPPGNTVEVRLASAPGGYITLSVLGTRILPVPTSLSPNPLTVTAGATGTLNATLSPAPTAAGVLSVSSANTGVATVPATVAFAPGQTLVPLPVTGLASGTTTVTASANGGSASATVNVNPAPPTITQLAPASMTLMQNSSGALTVTISAAQASDTSVALASSNSAIASVPFAVSVPAGALTAGIPVTAASPGDAQITASLNGSSAVSQVTVTPLPPTVVSLLPAVSTVTLGAGTTLTLTISASQSTDTVVPLGVTPGGIVNVPAQVSIPAGQLSVAVPVATLAYGQAGITATLNGSMASAAVNVVPPPISVTALEPATFTMTVGATSTFTVRINAAQTTNTDIALASSDPAVLQVPTSVTIAQGATSATFTATGLAVGDSTITASANGTARTAAVHVSPQPAAILSLLPNPLPLQQGANGSLTVTVNVAQEVDTTILLANTNPAVAGVPQNVILVAGAISAQIPVTALAAGSAEVTASVNGTSAVSVIDVTPPPPFVTAITPAALSLPKGTPGVLRVTVSRAPNAATAVALLSSDQAVASVPPQVNIPAGALFADFPVTSNSVGQATISATLNGGSASSIVTVSPAELVMLTLSPQTPTNYVGESVPFTATGTMTDGTTEDFTTRVAWSSSNTAVATIAATGVASVLEQGQTTIEASFAFIAVQTGQPVTVSQSTVLTAKIPTPLVLAAPTTSLQVTQTVTVTITTSDAPPYGGLMVNLTGGGTGAGTFPPSVLIPEYQTTATFDFTATAAGSYTLTASAQNRLPGVITFTIQPPLAIHTIAPASGDVGTLVTLTGTGFDPVPANNQLAFRGINNTTVPAPALTSSATQITVRVPALAETGPITLTNGIGTVQSPPFTVTREQDFELVVNPGTVTVYQGASNLVQAQLSNTGTRQFTGLVTLTVDGLPAGLSASFAPAQTLSAFQTGGITLTATGAAAPGTYGATVKATFTEAGQPFVRSSLLSITVAASTNVTGLKGRFVTPEGHGIAGVIVRADTSQNPQPQTVADAAGNFVLTGLPAGQVTLRFDATPANPLYPIWPYTATIAANQIAVMADWTINPPPSDDKFTPIANATQDQIIVDPRFPGLAIKLPAGASIIGWDGVPKTRIAVERIMPDKLPVTAPPVPIRESYQLYFGTPMGGIPSAPIPVTLPNVAEAEPGTLLDVWFFDGSPMGGTGEWRVAGQGRVSDDGKSVAMLHGQGITRFCGVCGLVSLACPPPPKPPQPPSPPCNAGNPVNLFTGQEMPVRRGGLSCTGITQIEVGMSYNPVDAFGGRAGTFGSLGLGWTLDYDIAFLPFTGPQKRLILPPGKFVDFVDDGSGSYRNSDNPSFDGAIVRATNEAANEWELKYKDGQVWKFKPFAGTTGLIRGGPPTFVTEIVDPQGNSLNIARLTNGRVSAVGGPQRNVVFEYGANGFVSQVRDTANRTMAFTYTSDNTIETITDEDGKVTRFTYVGDGEMAADAACGVQPTMGKRIQTITYPGRANPTQNFYGPGKRVLRQIGWDGREQKFRYRVVGACITNVSNPGVKCVGASCPTEDSWENFQAGWRIHGGQVIATTVVQPNGASYSQVFNSQGSYVSQTDNQGQALKVKRDSVGRITERTDAIGRTWKYTYDAVGNVQTQIDPLGRITNYTHDSKWNTISTITRFDDANQPVVRSYQYDPNRGSILRSTDPLQHSTTYGYTALGQLARITTPTGEQTSYEYNAAGDLIKMTDPGGNEMLYGTDGAGRVVSRTNALGFTSNTEYTGTDRVSKTIDPLLQETRYTRDAANRISSVINPLNNSVETYEYDSGDRVIRRIDALGKFTDLTYDASGRLATVTDRNGRTTSYEYDEQNRAVRVIRHDRVQTLEYDAVGRLIRVDDGFSYVTYTHDLADRIVREVNSAGGQTTVIEYQYDALDRRTVRTVTSNGPNGASGPDLTTYAYDPAGRLLSVTYRGTGNLNEVTSYDWDASGRLVGKTLPNGIVTEFGYNASSRLSQITYKRTDGSVIEQIAYGIDAAGRRTSKTMSGATAAQETPFAASYDAANRMTSITLEPLGLTPKTYSLAYDDNGNLIRKERAADPTDVTTFEWDTSNRLKQILGPGYTASFTYDVIGRRVTRTVNGDTTAFAYSGMQVVGEIRPASTGPQQSTALVTGPQIDEVIARYSRTGATSDTPVGRVLLTDALGSVIAQTREDQSLQNFYSYTPYGEVLPIGDDEDNSIQYTSRESDSTGLYFYRARYYDPVLKRFIAQDPIGLSGGMNVYGYVEGNPVSFVDPFGETIYKGPNNSYSDIPPPAGQPCLRAIERYGAIVGWEPCTPPTPPSDPCPPQPPAPPPPPPTPPGNGPGTGTGAGPGTGPGTGGPGSGGTNQGCYWACISAGIGTYIVDTMTMGIFTDGIFPSLFDAAAVNNSTGQRVFWGGMKWASRGFGIIHVFHGAWGLNQSAPAMCEKACAE